MNANTPVQIGLRNAALAFLITLFLAWYFLAVQIDVGFPAVLALSSAVAALAFFISWCRRSISDLRFEVACLKIELEQYQEREKS